MHLAPDLVDRLSRVRPQRILVTSGAGISAESGIPTYRGQNGLWRQVDFERMASRGGFEEDPQRVWSWYRERRQGVLQAKPNPAHDAVAELAERTTEVLVVTQNVDDLHERAGLSPDRLVHVHGRILETRCEHCHSVAEARSDDGSLPCPLCNRPTLRPNVIWFGERLPAAELERVEGFLAQGSCDLVLVVGTTAVFAYVRDWIARGAGTAGMVVDINPESSRLADSFPQRAWHVQADAGLALPEVARCLA